MPDPMQKPSSDAFPEKPWQPVAGPELLKKRAALYRKVRGFFNSRGVLEVETPLLSASGTVDRHIDSFVTRAPEGGRHWLATSPEFFLKRLLAAGSGPIFQLGKVFRLEPPARWHNPEFTLLEWYRPGFDHLVLMGEVEELLRECGVQGEGAFPRTTWSEAFASALAPCPHTASGAALRTALAARRRGDVPEGIPDTDTDSWRDLWMSLEIGPTLGRRGPEFLYDFPASQAALARVRPGVDGGFAVAERFEVFWDGLELANGFHELSNADEQERRFVADRQARVAAGRNADTPPYDRLMVNALREGDFPSCAGVALGVDRLLARLVGADSLAPVLAFPWERA